MRESPQSLKDCHRDACISVPIFFSTKLSEAVTELYIGFILGLAGSVMNSCLGHNMY